MEAELGRLRKEITEMEARLQGRPSSSKLDSAGGGSDLSSSISRSKTDTKPRPVVRYSSDDDADELSGITI